MRNWKQKKDLPFEEAFDRLDDVATPAEIRELERKGKVPTEEVDRIRYNRPPPKDEDPKHPHRRP